MRLPTKITVVDPTFVPTSCGVFITGKTVLNRQKTVDYFNNSIEQLLKGDNEIPIELPVVPFGPFDGMKTDSLNKVFTDGVRKLITKNLEAVTTVKMRGHRLTDLRACFFLVNIIQHFARANVDIVSYEDLEKYESREMVEQSHIDDMFETVDTLLKALSRELSAYGLSSINFKFAGMITIFFKHDNSGKLFVFDFPTKEDMINTGKTLEKELGFAPA